MSSPLLALDIGLKRTGVALSESGLIAQPLTVIEAKPPHMTNVVEEVIRQIKEYGIKTLVIGVPYTQEEAATTQALKTEQVIKQIEDSLAHYELEVEMVRVNEYHSTRDANLLFPHTDPDSAAATIILQDYIDQNLI